MYTVPQQYLAARVFMYTALRTTVLYSAVNLYPFRYTVRCGTRSILLCCVPHYSCTFNPYGTLVTLLLWDKIVILPLTADCTYTLQ